MSALDYPDDNKTKAVEAGGYGYDSPDFEDGSDGPAIGKITALVNEDKQHDIQYRSMSWQKAAWLLAGDQVCLAIMAQTW